MRDGSEQAAPASPRRVWAGAGGLVVAVGTAYFLLPLEGLGGDRPWLGWPLFALCLGLLAALLLRQVRDVVLEKPHTRPGVMIPLLMCLAVLVFSSGYYALAQRPGQFTWPEHPRRRAVLHRRHARDRRLRGHHPERAGGPSGDRRSDPVHVRLPHGGGHRALAPAARGGRRARPAPAALLNRGGCYAARDER